MGKHETRHFRGVWVRVVWGPLKVGKEPIESRKRTYWKFQVVLCLLHQTSPCSRGWVSAVKLEAIGQQKKRVEGNYNYTLFAKLPWPGDSEGTFRYCSWIRWHMLQCHPSYEGRDRSIDPYIHVWRRESKRFLAYLRWDDLRPLQRHC